MNHKDSIIVEPTSGNQGIGLALVGAVRGYKTIIIMPDSVSEERRKLVRHYGAEVILIHDAGNIGDCIDECMKTALKMQEENPRVYVPQQFDNPANPMTHKHKTGLEILEQVGGPIDGFCSGVGTGGTISGIGETLKAQNPDIVIWAVEPEHAAILAGGTVGTHLQMGIGDGLIPNNLNREIYEDIYIVTDEEAIQTAKDLDKILFVIKHIERINHNCKKIVENLTAEKKITFSARLNKFTNRAITNTTEMFELCQLYIKDIDCLFLLEDKSSYDRFLELSKLNSEVKLSAKAHVIENAAKSRAGMEKNTTYMEITSYLNMISNNLSDIVFMLSADNISKLNYEQIALEELNTETNENQEEKKEQDENQTESKKEL